MWRPQCHLALLFLYKLHVFCELHLSAEYYICFFAIITCLGFLAIFDSTCLWLSGRARASWTWRVWVCAICGGRASGPCCGSSKSWKPTTPRPWAACSSWGRHGSSPSSGPSSVRSSTKIRVRSSWFTEARTTRALEAWWTISIRRLYPTSLVEIVMWVFPK